MLQETSVREIVSHVARHTLNFAGLDLKAGTK